MIRLTDDEIRVESKAYHKESQEIWDSDKPRQEKAELSMDLQSVYDRIAKAQLKKFMEWLETKGHLERDEGSGDWYWEFDFIVRDHDWQSLLEEKDDCKA